MPTGITVRVGETPNAKVIKGVSAYSVDEESTPVDVSDTTGATGRFSFSFFRNAISATQAKRMRRKTVRLEDLGQGTTIGIARTPSHSQGTTTISVDLRTTLLAVERTAQPYTGDVAGYFVYLLGLVGIDNEYVTDPSFVGMPAVFPGWQGNVYLQMKKMLAAVGAEVSLASDKIVLRPLRGRVAVDKRDSDVSWSDDDSNLALSVEGYWYSNAYRLADLAYPKGGWTEDVQVYQVDARETITFDIPIEASLTSVVQPVSMNNVTREENSSSVYSVMSNDGYPYSAAQWDAEGGSVTVGINEDTRSLTVTIVGADNERYAPFRIAATAGPSDNYSSLRIIGEGVFFEKNLVTINTALSADVASQEVGTTVDSEFITSYTMLLDRLVWTLGRYGGPRQTLNVRTVGINRQGESGSYSYPTIADFNAYAILQGWSDIGDFNAFYAGELISDFNAWWIAQSADSFVNQAFGNIAGARRREENVFYRIRRATIDAANISYTAEADTTVGDFNDEWSPGGVPLLISDFNTQWAGMTVNDFNCAPLERSA